MTVNRRSDVTLSRSRIAIKKLVQQRFLQGWQFQIIFEGINQPADFNLFVKDVTLGGRSVELDTKQVGVLVYNKPNSVTPVTLTATMLDTDDGKISKWFEALTRRAFNDDGTINLPASYTFDLYLNRLTAEGHTIEYGRWKMLANEIGEITQDKSAVTEFTTFPITFTQYKSRR